jgi:hypothetical protein
MYYAIVDKFPIEDQWIRFNFSTLQKSCIDTVISKLYKDTHKTIHFESPHKWKPIEEISLKKHLENVEYFIDIIKPNYINNGQDYKWLNLIKEALVEFVTETIKNHNSQLPLTTKIVSQIRSRVNA